MAKTADVRRIVMPTSEGPHDKFKLDTSEQVDSSKDFSDALKVDSGSELTPRSRLSWANEVEEEHEAIGWTGNPRAKVVGQDGVQSEDVAVKRSKKKKKKKKNKTGAAAEEVSSTPADSNLDEQSKAPSHEKQPNVEFVEKSALPPMAKAMSESESNVDSFSVQPEVSNTPAKGTGANGHGSTQIADKDAEADSSPYGRNKPNSLSATSILVSRNTEDQKVVNKTRGKGTVGSLSHPAGVRDTQDGHRDMKPSVMGTLVESGDSGWEVAGSHKSRRGQEKFGKSAEVPVSYSNDYALPPSSDGNWDVELPSRDVPSSNWDSGWEVAGSHKRRGGQQKSGKSADIPVAYSNDFVPTPSSEGNWDEDLPPTEITPNWNSSWEVAGSHKGRRGQETFVKSLDVPAGQSNAYVPPDGNRDEELPSTDVPSSNWDSGGWEVAGSRRNKRGDDPQAKSLGVPNLGQRSRGRGQQSGGKFNEQVQRGNKQRSGEWEKVTRGRSAGNIAQDKSGRRSPRNNTGRGEGIGNVPSPSQPLTQSAWSKPVNKLTHSSSNFSTSSLSGSQNSSATTAAKGVSRVGSSGILGNLFPAERGLPEQKTGLDQSSRVLPPDIDSWKGGFPAFSGDGSSVFDEYPGSLYSDSQCSDDEFDSDTMSLASFDSAASHKSHATQKKDKWFRNFFEDLDELTEEQLQEHDRQWHCPACQGGVGAIDWYRGLQPLLSHARTVRSKRVKLHKAFVEVLEEEVRIRGAAAGTHGSGKYGKWRGLSDDHDNKDTLIVWPPMVVIRNTQLEQDEVDKWIGMGNKELLDLFKKHNPVKARHAYGPQGHRGISILIFPESPTGYYDAQRLDKHFRDARRGRDNWNSQGKVLFQPGGDRILYGYMASPEDLDIFNKHSKGKQNLKWEQRSLQETVLIPMRKMDEENTKVVYLQGQMQREMEASKTLKKTMSQMMKKLHMREDELKVIRERAKEQYKQQEMEMEDMEALYKSKIEQLKQEILEKEAGIQKVHEDYEQEHLEQCEQLEQRAMKIPKDKNLSDELRQQQTLVEEEIARHSQLVELCIKRQEEWEARKVELLKEHHQKLMEFKSRQWQELLAFEKSLEKERITIMDSFKLPSANE